MGTLRFALPLVALALVTLATSRRAEGASVDVTANVVATCSVTVVPLSFGTYDIGDPTDATGLGSLTTDCSASAPFMVTFDQGLYPAPSSTDDAPARRMGSSTSSDTIGYELLCDGQPVGATASSALLGFGAASAESHVLSGRIPAQQLVASGTYTDTVVATITY